MTEAFVALGANLGEPHKALEKALAAMDALEGVKVKKGQLIGYVGTSGMVTGPHLHYELKKDGQQINPLIADLRTGENLKDDALEDYKLAISPMRRQIAMLSRLQLAQNSASTGSD